MVSPTLTRPVRRRVSREDQLRQVWDTRPGWGIAANLMPPELIGSYRLRRLRERLLLLVCLVGLLTAAGFAYGFWRTHQADSALAQARSRTTQLQGQAAQYSAVTRIQGSVSQVRAQLSHVLSGDVDVAALVGRIEGARPPGVAISALTVTLDGQPGQSGQAGQAGGPDAGSLDTSGAAHIGTIEIDGTGGRIDDLPAFVDAIGALPGVVDVLPTSNVTQASGTKFSLTLTVTDKLYTHRFDPSPSGAPSPSASPGASPSPGTS